MKKIRNKTLLLIPVLSLVLLALIIGNQFSGGTSSKQSVGADILDATADVINSVPSEIVKLFQVSITDNTDTIQPTQTVQFDIKINTTEPTFDKRKWNQLKVRVARAIYKKDYPASDIEFRLVATLLSRKESAILTRLDNVAFTAKEATFSYPVNAAFSPVPANKQLLSSAKVYLYVTDPQLGLRRALITKAEDIDRLPASVVPTPAKPVITGFSANGRATAEIQMNQFITLVGTNFATTATNGIYNQVYFNNQVIAPNLISADGRTMSFRLPSSIRPGTYLVMVKNANGQSERRALRVRR